MVVTGGQLCVHRACFERTVRPSTRQDKHFRERQRVGAGESVHETTSAFVGQSRRERANQRLRRVGYDGRREIRGLRTVPREYNTIRAPLAARQRRPAAPRETSTGQRSKSTHTYTTADTPPPIPHSPARGPPPQPLARRPPLQPPCSSPRPWSGYLGCRQGRFLGNPPRMRCSTCTATG